MKFFFDAEVEAVLIDYRPSTSSPSTWVVECPHTGMRTSIEIPGILDENTVEELIGKVIILSVQASMMDGNPRIQISKVQGWLFDRSLDRK